MPSFSGGNYGFVAKISSKKVLLTADTKRQNASLDPKDFCVQTEVRSVWRARVV